MEIEDLERSHIIEAQEQLVQQTIGTAPQIVEPEFHRINRRPLKIVNQNLNVLGKVSEVLTDAVS